MKNNKKQNRVPITTRLQPETIKVIDNLKHKISLKTGEFCSQSNVIDMCVMFCNDRGVKTILEYFE